MTGGRTFTVQNINDLPDVATKISMELRNQYVLGYRPSEHKPDGKWRKIKVKLRPPKGLPPLTVFPRSAIMPRGISLRELSSPHLSCIHLHRTSSRLWRAAPNPQQPLPPAAASARASSAEAPIRRSGLSLKSAATLIWWCCMPPWLDDKGNFVPGLKPENFRVFEDKVEQKISHLQARRFAGDHGVGDRQQRQHAFQALPGECSRSNLRANQQSRRIRSSS